MILVVIQDHLVADSRSYLMITVELCYGFFSLGCNNCRLYSINDT